jgi:hypothetical protein
MHGERFFHAFLSLHEAPPTGDASLPGILAKYAVKDANARTSLHEAMASGALLAFAPPFLEREIEKYIPNIAAENEVSVYRVREEWQLLKTLIHFYEPLNSGQPAICADPKDLPYIHAQQQLGADFVFTADPHFVAMGARVMPQGFDRVLRDYARGTSILLTVKLGSSFAIIGGFELISALAKLIAGASCYSVSLSALHCCTQPCA